MTNDLSAAFLKASIGYNYEPQSDAEALFAAAAWQFKRAGGTHADFMRVGVALFLEMPGVGQCGPVADGDHARTAHTGLPMPDEDQPGAASDGQRSHVPVRPPIAGDVQMTCVSGDQRSADAAGNLMPGEDQMIAVSHDQEQRVPARLPIPDAGHWSVVGNDLRPDARVGNLTASEDQIAHASDGHQAAVSAGAPHADSGDRPNLIQQDLPGDVPAVSSTHAGGEGQAASVHQDQATRALPTGSPIAGAERPFHRSPQGQNTSASPAREPNADVNDQVDRVHPDLHSTVVHVREHLRGVPRVPAKLPTEEQRAAMRRAGRNVVIGAYQLKGRRSMRNEKVREQPVQRDRSIKKAGEAMNKAVLPNLTDAGVRQRVIEKAHSTSQTVSEVMDQIAWNQAAEAAYVDAVVMARKSLQAMEAQITKGK